MQRNNLRIIIIGVVVLICVIPIVYIPMLSLVRRWEAFQLLPSEWSTAHWQDALHDVALYRSIAVSILISCIVALVSTAVGFATSRFIAKHPRHYRLMILAYAPFAMSPVIFGASAHIVFIKFGLSSTIIGVILAQAMFGCAFAVIILSSFWNEQVFALENLARTLGASRLDIAWYVLIPIARNFLVLTLVQTFLLSWFQYGLTLIIGGGVVQTLPLLVYSAINEANPYYAAVNASILIFPALAMIFIHKNVLIERF